MRQLKFENVQKIYEAIWPDKPVTIAGGTAIDESHISMQETWWICDWADLYGFDSDYLRAKVIAHLASFGLEPYLRHDKPMLQGIWKDFEGTKARIDLVYGIGSDYHQDQANKLKAPIEVDPHEICRNQGVIDICLTALGDAGVIPVSNIEQRAYAKLLQAAFAQHLAILWTPEDVEHAMPGMALDSRFVSDVFDLTHKHHDAEYGISWEVLRSHAEKVADSQDKNY